MLTKTRGVVVSALTALHWPAIAGEDMSSAHVARQMEPTSFGEVGDRRAWRAGELGSWKWLRRCATPRQRRMGAEWLNRVYLEKRSFSSSGSR